MEGVRKKMKKREVEGRMKTQQREVTLRVRGKLRKGEGRLKES